MLTVKYDEQCLSQKAYRSALSGHTFHNKSIKCNGNNDSNKENDANDDYK